ncbi:MAG: hypothetical protein JWO06_3046 [Bacteroidota bacterium]|nr:hypothetical protein [Bacteroidota bacterium]
MAMHRHLLRTKVGGSNDNDVKMILKGADIFVNAEDPNYLFFPYPGGRTLLRGAVALGNLGGSLGLLFFAFASGKLSL